MSESHADSLIELANFLSIEDLAKLIEINKGRIFVFNEGLATMDEISTTNEVTMNGASIQITVNDSV